MNLNNNITKDIILERIKTQVIKKVYGHKDTDPQAEIMNKVIFSSQWPNECTPVFY